MRHGYAHRRAGRLLPNVPARHADQDGVALLLALLLVTLLSVIVVEFSYETQVEAALATNDSADLEAYVAAKSAVATGMALLAGDLLENEMLAGTDFDSPIDVWAMDVPVQPFNSGVMRCAIDDEYGKLNLNAMIRTDENGEAVENELLVEALRVFFELRIEEFDLDENPTDAILDWLDPDSEPRPEGAELDFYTALEIPYPCKNGPMDSIKELLMIRGVTPEIYFGIPQERLGPDEEMPLPITEYLTVHGHPHGRVNVNTAELETLDALFEVWGQPGKVDRIIARRADEVPFTSMEDLEDIFGRPRKGEVPFKDVLTVSSRVFRIYGDGVADEVKVRVEAYVWRNPGAGTREDPIEAQEAFRILDWREIR